MNHGFIGFPKDFFAFFRELKAHNERSWFEANKERFRDSVQAPMSEFIAAMAPPLAKLSKEFIADPRPHGGSMFRIYRDVRFSKDKRPYKEHGAVQFRHRLGRDVHAPGFYVHLGPKEVFFGGGLWMPLAPELNKVRQEIDYNFAEWTKIIGDRNFKKVFQDGLEKEDMLSRPPKGYDDENPAIEFLKLKSFIVTRTFTDAELQAKSFLKELLKTFEVMGDFVHFINRSLE